MKNNYLKKILIFICLSFLISTPSFSLTAEKYLIDRNSSDSVKINLLQVYIKGVGVANFWTNVTSSVLLDQNLFCPPNTWSPKINDYLSYVDAEIVHRKNKGNYYKTDHIEFYMITYLVRTYPCK
jgi:hypothetical protein